MAEKRTRERMPAPEKVGSVVFSSLSGTPLGKKLNELRVWSVWQKAAGSQISAVAHPVKIVNGILTVGVSSSPWLQQLQFLKKELLNSINRSLGEEIVNDIYLKSGDFRKELTSDPKNQDIVLKDLSESEKRHISELSDLLTDEELKLAAKRLLEKASMRDIAG